MSRLLRATAIALLSVSIGATASARSSITGVCPDGSMFIVKRKVDIPCPQAKQVDPHDLPPIRPAYLPRPYGWQVFQNKHDPNNPYNLVDQAQTIRDAGEPVTQDRAPGAAVAGQTSPPRNADPPAPRVHAAVAPVAAPPPSAPQAPEISPVERRDLTLIVELSQQHSRARFAAQGAALVIELAHSPAFEERVHAHYAGETLGPVVLFSAEARTPTEFHANFTFVQGHAAYHPRGADPRRLALLAGEFGPLGAGESVLGYAVLPVDTDLAEPIDIYWNDRLITVALSR